MIDLDTKHKRGKKTFTYLYFRHGWWFTLLGLLCFYLSASIYLSSGRLHGYVLNFLNQHPDWYISIPMLSEWLLLLGIALIFVGYLLVNVHYRMYKFILDEYAVHLHRGLFFTRETTIPYHHISNVRIERPYHFKIFGIAKVDIVTAADRTIGGERRSTGEFLIPVIDIKIARELSHQLLESASKSRKREHASYEDDADDDTDQNEDQ